jgi:hypothetical protein
MRCKTGFISVAVVAASLLLVFLVNTVAAKPLELILYRGQFVTAYVGENGHEVMLQIQFGSDDILLYLATPSATYDPVTSSEFFSLGTGHQYRWTVQYTSGGSSSGDSTPHQGVLGLGDGSPIWRNFDALTKTSSRLYLGWYAPHASPIARSANVTIDMRRQVTLATWQLYSRWLNESIDTPTSVPLVQFSINNISIRLPIHDLGVSAGRDVRLIHLSPTSRAPVVTIGSLHLQSFLIAHVHSTGVWAAAPLVRSGVYVRRHEYLWLFIAVFLLAWAWFPALAEVRHHRYWAYAAASAPSRRSSTAASTSAAVASQPLFGGRGMFAVVFSCSLWTVLLALFVVHGSLQSYESMQEMHEPYGSASSTLAWVVYYTLLVWIAVTAVALSAASSLELSDATVMLYATALYLLAWLILVCQFEEITNLIFMILLSALAFLRQSDLAIRSFYHRRWIVSRSWQWQPWAWALTTLATGLFFAYYTVAEYINERWPDHPSAFFIELFVLFITWAVGAFEPFIREHAVHYLELARKFFADQRVAGAVSMATRRQQYLATNDPQMTFQTFGGFEGSMGGAPASQSALVGTPTSWSL